MISYVQLRSWRSLCEFLDQQHYKFAEPSTIDRHAKVELRKIYAADGVEYRRLLKDLYLISFIRWGNHPVLNYSHSRQIRRQYGEIRGWILLTGWEHKIFFLEQICLFKRDRSLLPMPWHESARQYHLEQNRERRRRLETYRKELKRKKTVFFKKVQSRIFNDLCWNCGRPIMTLMLDCVCGKPYDGWENVF